MRLDRRFRLTSKAKRTKSLRMMGMRTRKRMSRPREMAARHLRLLRMQALERVH